MQENLYAWLKKSSLRRELSFWHLQGVFSVTEFKSRTRMVSCRYCFLTWPVHYQPPLALRQHSCFHQPSCLRQLPMYQSDGTLPVALLHTRALSKLSRVDLLVRNLSSETPSALPSSSPHTRRQSSTSKLWQTLSHGSIRRLNSC